MKTVNGDLIEMAKNGKFDVIVHGCNCKGVMGAGIAKQIKQLSDVNFRNYHLMCSTRSDKDLLGDILVYNHDTVTDCMFDIVNAFTQLKFGVDERQVSYDAVDSCFEKIKNRYSPFSNIRIGFPMIGAGLGGGNWEIIKMIIESHMKDLDATLVVFDK